MGFFDFFSSFPHLLKYKYMLKHHSSFQMELKHFIEENVTFPMSTVFVHITLSISTQSSLHRGLGAVDCEPPRPLILMLWFTPLYSPVAMGKSDYFKDCEAENFHELE